MRASPCLRATRLPLIQTFPNLIPEPEHEGEQFFNTYNIQDVVSFEISPQHTIFVFGLLYKSDYGSFGRFEDPVARCRGLINHIKNAYIDREGVYRPARTTFVALTYQTLADDIELAKAVPELRLIMGGHDHEVVKRVSAGRDQTIIVKTKSNARTLRLN